jgi:3-dehydroquinate dehydratase II
MDHGPRRHSPVARILVLNGPNLDRLGTREPAIYGEVSLTGITARLEGLAGELGHRLSHFQSNAEHELIARVHQAADEQMDFLIVNPAAFTHTSIALRDAISASGLPFIEIHLSNPAARESFRRRNYFSDIANGCISGLGAYGYELALRAADHHLKQMAS